MVEKFVIKNFKRVVLGQRGRIKCQWLIIMFNLTRAMSKNNLESQGTGSRQVDIDELSVGVQLTNEVRSEPTLRISVCSRSSDGGKDFIPSLGWSVWLKEWWRNSVFMYDLWDLKNLLLSRAKPRLARTAICLCWKAYCIAMASINLSVKTFGSTRLPRRHL